jgi:protein-S-isoprenylcysteine O-methyltransferase Ste14
MKTFYDFVFRFRNVLAALPLVFALFCTHGEWESEAGVWTLATVVSLAGVAMRRWANSHCNYRKPEKNRLTTTGPYALTRSPLYIGSILVLAGATIASELAWLLPVTVLWSWLVYHLTVRREEIRLAQKYGDEFREYARQVPRWIPRLGLSGARELLIDAAPLLLLALFLLKEFNVFGLGS